MQRGIKQAEDSGLPSPLPLPWPRARPHRDHSSAPGRFLFPGVDPRASAVRRREGQEREGGPRAGGAQRGRETQTSPGSMGALEWGAASQRHSPFSAPQGPSLSLDGAGKWAELRAKHSQAPSGASRPRDTVHGEEPVMQRTPGWVCWGQGRGHLHRWAGAGRRPTTPSAFPARVWTLRAGGRRAGRALRKGGVP